MLLKPTRLRLAGVACAAATMFCGCGDSASYKLVPVSGRVTLDGAPVPQTSVTFQPRGSADNTTPGPSSAAICDDAGRFELRTIRDEAGAVVGPHTVRISSMGSYQIESASDTNQGPLPTDAFPAQFNVNSQLSFEVPADGTDKANFELKSKP